MFMDTFFSISSSVWLQTFGSVLALEGTSVLSLPVRAVFKGSITSHPVRLAKPAPAGSSFSGGTTYPDLYRK